MVMIGTSNNREKGAKWEALAPITRHGSQSEVEACKRFSHHCSVSCLQTHMIEHLLIAVAPNMPYRHCAEPTGGVEFPNNSLIAIVACKMAVTLSQIMRIAAGNSIIC